MGGSCGVYGFVFGDRDGYYSVFKEWYNFGICNFRCFLFLFCLEIVLKFLSCWFKIKYSLRFKYL